MAKIIDSLEYVPDSFDVAPKEEWSIMQINEAKVSKNLPRFCLPACEFYLADSDKVCKRLYECDYYVFDAHVVEKGEKVYDVVFATKQNDPHCGLMWRVGDKYLRQLLGDARVEFLLQKYYNLVTPPEGGIVI